jgi:hypothetical protein
MRLLTLQGERITPMAQVAQDTQSRKGVSVPANTRRPAQLAFSNAGAVHRTLNVVCSSMVECSGCIRLRVIMSCIVTSVIIHSIHVLFERLLRCLLEELNRKLRFVSHFQSQDCFSIGCCGGHIRLSRSRLYYMHLKSPCIALS